MKKLFAISLILLAAVSCDKEPVGIQKVSFPETTKVEGMVEVETIFNQEGVRMEVLLPASGAGSGNAGVGSWDEYSSAFNKIISMSKPGPAGNTRYKARVYFGNMTPRNASDDTIENISIIVSPDDETLAGMNDIFSSGYDFSDYKGCGLIAVSDLGGIFVIDEFLEKDILGTMNGLVKWMNEYADTRDSFSSDNAGKDLPDALKLFSSFQGGYTYTFRMDKKEVADVACSSKDYLSGRGSVDFSFRITPLHAFDDQTGKGDYYLVMSTVSFNSAGMYSGNYTSMHGGVHVRICGAFSRSLGLKSFISKKGSTVPVGIFVADGTPKPTTTISSVTYTRGVTWSIGASVTGGITMKGTGPEATDQATISGGVQINNTETRNISDVDIMLKQSGNNVAEYQYVFNNLPEYKASISISNPPKISVSTATFEHSYIIYIENVRDNSTEQHQINMQVSQLNYGAYRFYTTGADGKDWTWGLGDMSQKTYVGGNNGSVAIPLPNRTPTGKLKITHDDVSAGNYLYEIKATSVANPEKVYEFNKDSYAKGESFGKYLPTGKYNVSIKLGNNRSSLTEYKSSKEVEIVRGDDTKLNTGGDFSKVK